MWHENTTTWGFFEQEMLIYGIPNTVVLNAFSYVVLNVLAFEDIKILLLACSKPSFHFATLSNCKALAYSQLLISWLIRQREEVT